MPAMSAIQEFSDFALPYGVTGDLFGIPVTVGICQHSKVPTQLGKVLCH